MASSKTQRKPRNVCPPPPCFRLEDTHNKHASSKQHNSTRVVSATQHGMIKKAGRRIFTPTTGPAGKTQAGKPGPFRPNARKRLGSP